MTSLVLRIIALISMTCDHVGTAVYGTYTPMNIIGRLAFPLFCFGIALGAKKTSDVKKYAMRLTLVAIISQIPYFFYEKAVGADYDLNVIFTLLTGLLLIIIYRFDVGTFSRPRGRKKQKFQLPTEFEFVTGWAFKIILMISTIMIAQIAKMDYGAPGALTVLFMYILLPNVNKKGKIEKPKDKKFHLPQPMKSILYLMWAVAFPVLTLQGFLQSLIGFNIRYAILTYAFILIGFGLPLLYNGKKGNVPKYLKYFSYIYYPLHLTILIIILQFIK